MINIFLHHNNQATFKRLLKTSKGRLSFLRPITYRQVFRDLSFPQGSMIFTDFDYLSAAAIEAAAGMAKAALSASPDTKILNHPSRACERYELLKRLKSAGISDIEVNRIDSGTLPTRYPVFIRSEDGAFGAETPLLECEADYRQAIDDLRAAGKPSKRRVALSYEGEEGQDGFFRKFGAFRVGDRIVPQHLLYKRHWKVKSSARKHNAAFAAEELTYVRDNPDADLIKHAFQLGDLEFGRIDYSFKNGKPVIFEINTNPIFPRLDRGRDERTERRQIIFDRLVTAFQDVDSAETGRTSIRFSFDEPVRKFIEYPTRPTGIGQKLRRMFGW